MALVVRRTAAAGGADATQTNAQGVWNILTALLTSAGWTTLDTITAQDIVYHSTGESGNEHIYVRLQWVTTFLNMYIYQYWDAVGHAGYNMFNPGAVGSQNNQYSYVNGNVVNYVMVADLDSFVGITNDSANAKRNFGAGIMKRLSQQNSTPSFVANGSVTAGANKTFSFSSGNPVAAGYQVGDRVFVVSQQTTGPAAGVIPLYAAYVTAVTTSSLTIDFAQENTNSGAMIGSDPMPAFCLQTAANVTPQNSNYLACMYKFTRTENSTTGVLGPTNLYQQNPTQQGVLANTASTGATPFSSAAEQDPNNRTSRVGVGEYVAIINTEEVLGIVPKHLFNPRTTDAQWSIARSTKEATNFDYVTVPGTSPSTGPRVLIGPIAISGSSNYVIDVYRFDAQNYLEADYVVTPEGAPDRVSPRTFNNSRYTPDMETFRGTLFGDDENESMLQGEFNLIGNDAGVNAADRTAGAMNANQTAVGGESYPFDSITGGGGGTGGSGFNTGFN